MDNTAITAGATLYFPVFADGALFGCGDMHAVMGDGEISVSGAEAAGWATVTLTAMPELKLVDPLIENATHFGVIASAETLDAAADRAVHEMLDLICDRTAEDPDQGCHAAVACRRCAGVPDGGSGEDDPLHGAQVRAGLTGLQAVGASL